MFSGFAGNETIKGGGANESEKSRATRSIIRKNRGMFTVMSLMSCFWDCFFNFSIRRDSRWVMSGVWWKSEEGVIIRGS
jgi:hypothetical protein